VRIDGKVIHSTAGRLHEAFRPFAPDVDLPAFVEALQWSWQEAERMRGDSHREVAAPERLRLLIGRLGLDASRLPSEAVPLLLSTHRRELSKARVLPAHHATPLNRPRVRHRLPVVSNFAYAPAAEGHLGRQRLAALLEGE